MKFRHFYLPAEKQEFLDDCESIKAVTGKEGANSG
jgi:hypothetical protein